MFRHRLPPIIATLSLAALSFACSDDTSSVDGDSTSTETGDTSGDGDGDPTTTTTTGDGDGDMTGDGDGDPATGDGDGDMTGDGDGDMTGDGDGDMTGDGDGDMTGDGDGDPMPEEGLVRVLHLSPDAPAVEVYLDDAMMPVGPAASFQDGTDYLALPVGLHSLRFVPEGGDPMMPALQIDDIDVQLDTKYSVVAHNYVEMIQGLVLTDDDAMIPMDTARAQVVHAAPDVGQVDILLLTDPMMPAPVLEDVDYGGSAVLELPTGAELPIGIDVNDDQVPDLLFTIPDLGSGTFVDLYAANDAPDMMQDPPVPGAVFLLAHLPDGSTLRLDPIDVCGDPWVTGAEVCDGDNLAGNTCPLGGDLACNDTCDGFIEDGCDNSLVVCNEVDVPVDIPDNDVNGVNIEIDVPNDIVIGDLNVQIDITHTWLNDTNATLTSPAGTDVILWSEVRDTGGGTCSGNDMSAVTLDDESMNVFECVEPGPPSMSGDYPIQGDAQNQDPPQTLAEFDGESSAGTWNLFINDTAGGDSGAVNELCVEISL